jgi:hypothetical protein
LFAVEWRLLEMELGKEEGEFQDGGWTAAGAQDAGCLENRYSGNQPDIVRGKCTAQAGGSLFFLQ